MKIPMREKYVDEAIGVYMVFGQREDGTVDVSDANKDIFTGLPQDIAEQVVAAHDEFRAKVYKLLCEA